MDTSTLKNESNSSDEGHCGPPTLSPHVIDIFVHIYMPLFGVSLFVNLFIIFIFIRHKKIHTVSNAFVFVVCLADCCVCVNVGLLAIMQLRPHMLNMDPVDTKCTMQTFMRSWSIAASYLTVTMLCFHRAIRLASSQNHYSFLYGSKRKVCLWCVFPFLLAAVFSAGSRGHYHADTTSCHAEISSSIVAGITYVIIYVINIGLWIKTYRRLRGFQWKSMVYMDPKKKQLRERHSTSLKISLYLSIFSIHLYAPALVLEPLVLEPTCIPSLWSAVGEVLMVVCSATNGLLYGAFNSNYQHYIRRNLWCCLKQDDRFPEPGDVSNAGFSLSMISVRLSTLGKRFSIKLDTVVGNRSTGVHIEKSVAPIRVKVPTWHEPGNFRPDKQKEEEGHELKVTDSLYNVNSIDRLYFGAGRVGQKESLYDMPDQIAHASPLRCSPFSFKSGNTPLSFKSGNTPLPQSSHVSESGPSSLQNTLRTKFKAIHSTLMTAVKRTLKLPAPSRSDSLMTEPLAYVFMNEDPAVELCRYVDTENGLPTNVKKSSVVRALSTGSLVSRVADRPTVPARASSVTSLNRHSVTSDVGVGAPSDFYNWPDRDHTKLSTVSKEPKEEQSSLGIMLDKLGKLSIVSHVSKEPAGQAGQAHGQV